MPTPDYHLPSFHFSVEFLFSDEQKKYLTKLGTGDAYFQSVSGLNAEMQTETLKEGGENRFEHVLPARTKYSDLILKRGLLRDSGLIQWCRMALEGFVIMPVNLKVNLLDENHEALVIWEVAHAWPKKWSVTDFNAEQSALLIETMELNYNFYRVRHSNPVYPENM